MKLTQIRLPDELAAGIDKRRGEMSRNEWMVRALTWALSQPPRTERTEVKV